MNDVDCIDHMRWLMSNSPFYDTPAVHSLIAEIERLRASNDSPAHDAADRWLDTRLGRVTLRRAVEDPENVREMLHRAFRTGFLLGSRKNEGG